MFTARAGVVTGVSGVGGGSGVGGAGGVGDDGGCTAGSEPPPGGLTRRSRDSSVCSCSGAVESDDD